ncbi:MAG: glycine zipper 2TM domain-containing protein [Gammaproteobacteria bacterium]|nr:glycine zipper 2TM domain-containing protein [Gammaproteobacteria bacterium]
MTRLSMTLLALTMAWSFPAIAEHKASHNPRPHARDSGDRYYRDDAGPGYDYATVLRSIPVHDRVRVSTPRERCWAEEVPVEVERGGSDSMTGTIVGGIIGAAVGNAVGHHSTNKKVGAVAGGLLGASIGHDVSNRGNTEVRYEHEQRCETVDEVEYEERIVGYDVTYRYGGETRTTRLERDPGNSLRVRVDVTPAE